MGTIADEAKKCVEVMRKGGVILYPTDTVWGLGCDASNSDAVKRVYEIKQRCDSKAMLLLVDSADRLARYVGNVPAVAWDLIELTTKPLTIIYDGARNVAPALVAEDGEPTPGNFGEISPEIIEAVDYVVNYKQHEKGSAKSSSIIKLTSNGTVTIIRE